MEIFHCQSGGRTCRALVCVHVNNFFFVSSFFFLSFKARKFEINFNLIKKLVVVPPPSSPSSSTDSGVAAEDSQPSRDEESSQDDVTSESESSGSDMSQEGVSVELWVKICF